MALSSSVAQTMEQQKSSACDRCRRQKLRCPRDGPISQPCRRCVRAHLECVTGHVGRPGRPPKNGIRRDSGTRPTGPPPSTTSPPLVSRADVEVPSSSATTVAATQTADEQWNCISVAVKQMPQASQPSTSSSGHAASELEGETVVATESVPPPSETGALQQLLQLQNDLCRQMAAGGESGDGKRSEETPAPLSELLTRFSEFIGILDSLQDQNDDPVEVDQPGMTAEVTSATGALPNPEANAADADSDLTEFLPEDSDDWMTGWYDEEALSLAMPWPANANAQETAYTTSVDDSLCKPPTMGLEDPTVVNMVVSCYLHLFRRFYLVLSHAHRVLAAGDEAMCRAQLSIVPPSAISHLAVNADTLQIKLAIQTALHVVECAERKMGLASSSCIINGYLPNVAAPYPSERGICSRSAAAKAVTSAVLDMEEVAWKQDLSVAWSPRQAVTAIIRDLVEYIDLRSVT